MNIFPELEKLIQDGKVIQAVKRFREAYGTSLKESKDVIDMYRAHGEWPEDRLPEGGLQRASQSPSQGRPEELPPIERADEPKYIQEVRALWAQDRKIQAIKRYREETGRGLKDSKNEVEALCSDIALGQMDIMSARVQHAFSARQDTLTQRHLEAAPAEPEQGISIEKASPENAPTPETIPELQLDPAHPIWAALEAKGLSTAGLMMAEGVCNLEDGVLILGPDQLGFWVDRFHQWVERLAIERTAIKSVELSTIGQKAKLQVRHSKGTARFQDLKEDAAQQLEAALKNNQKASSGAATVTSSSSSAKQIRVDQDEKEARVIDWLLEQRFHNQEAVLKKLERLIDREHLRKAAQQLIDGVEQRGYGEVDLIECLSLNRFLKEEWVIRLEQSDYSELLRAEWSPPSPAEANAHAGRTNVGCLIGFAFVILIMVSVAYALILS